MRTVKLVRIVLFHFGVFVNRTLVPLDKPGLTLISGSNLDSDTASSNGSGKTTIFKAVSWALFGQTVDGLTTDVVTRGESHVYVSIDFEIDGVEYFVRRERKASSSRLSLTVGGVVVDRRRKADTQASIEELIGANFDTFRCISLFGQGDTARFASPATSDAARKALLGRLLGLDKYERARTYAREQSAACELKLGKLRDDYEQKDRGVEQARLAIALLQDEGKTFADIYTNGSERIDKAIERIQDLSKLIDSKESLLETLGRKLDDLRTELAELRNLERKANDLFTEKSRDVRAAAELVDLTRDGGNCPTCSRPLEDITKAASDRLEKLKKKLRKPEGFLDEIRQQLCEAKFDFEVVDDEFREVEREIATTRATRVEVEVNLDDLKENLEHAERTLEEIGEAVQAERDSLARYEDARLKIDAVIYEHESRKRGWEWWSRTGFGSKGVPAYAIEQILPELNAKTNEHLGLLSNGDITVCWSATTPGTTGKEKEILTCNVVIDALEGVAPSGGQLRKIELATEVALADLVASAGQTSFSALFFDEALDGLDATARRHVVTWLEDLAARGRSVFVVSHTDEIAERFDRIWTIQKQGGSAKFV